MAGRVITYALPRRALFPSILIALIVLGIVGVNNPALRRAGAAWSSARDGAGRVTTKSAGAAAALAPSALVSLNGAVFPQDEGTGSVVLGEYEGFFSATTRKITIQQRQSGEAAGPRAGAISGRFNPGTELSRGSAFSLSVVSSAFVSGGTNAPAVSGEIQLNNLTSSTLYNTRLVFTSFRVTGGNDAANVPGANGFAFYNDGMVPLGGKLNVSRSYGDIAPGGNSRAVWNFAVTNQPPNFSFAYKVIADVGVAVESVQPGAVQVSGSAGTTVVINGRGLSTPTIQLVNSEGNVAATLTVGSSTATQATVTIPAGTAPGVYSLRVTNQGGTVGGVGSGTLAGRLTVTSAPDGAHTLTGTISGFGDTGPFLINGDATINVPATILPGTVIYVKSGATLTIGASGNLTANGGVPGVTGAAGIPTPTQIVITAQRAAGEALPSSGSWGGIVATSTSTATMTMRNVVVEYAGSTTGAAITLTGSGRALRFTDSVVRNSAGSGIAAAGANDSLIGFTRNRIENNGTNANNPAVLVSGNGALGLFEIPGSDISTATSVGDPAYFYSSANEFAGNQVNVVQIGLDSSATSNDFTKSGVLVGQDSTPLRIEGSNNNPSIIGVVESVSAAMPGIDSSVQVISAEIGINPAAKVQLGQGMDLQVGDYPTNRKGGLAVNGFAGTYLGSAQGSGSDRLIEFDKVAGKGNFGSIYFTRLAKPSSTMNSVRVQSGGNGNRGNNPVVVEAITLSLTNSRIDGGVLDTLGARVNTGGSVFSNTTTTPSIDTIAGGIFGDRSLGIQAVLSNPTSIAWDPLSRGIFIADTPSGASYIRFLNTTRNTVVIGGVSIPAGVLKNIAGGGINLGENVPGTQADAGTVTGLAVSPDGNILYFIDSVVPMIRAINISSSSQTIAGSITDAGSVQTYASSGFGSTLYALATNPTTGDLHVIDSTPGVNKVLKIPANAASSTVAPVTVAGNGSTTTKDEDPFVPGAATSLPLFGPRAIAFKGNDLLISDAGHGRVIQVDSAGNATLIAQFPVKSVNPEPYPNNPYTAGIAVLGGKIYLANGNAQDLIRVDTAGTSATFTTIAGTILTPCEYAPGANCGDGGPASQALFTLASRTTVIPLVGLASDGKGLYIADQGPNRGRIRYINISTSSVEVAGVKIETDNIDTVAGIGLSTPYDGALATSGALSQPVGVTLDPEGNLWIADTLAGKIRFVNMGTSSKTLFAGTTSEIEVPPGVITSINRDQGSKPDPAPVVGAVFDNPQGLFATAEGLYVADSKKGPPTQGSTGRRTGLLRFINTSSKVVTFYSGGAAKIDVQPGDIATIAGGSTNGDLNNPGDGASPTAAKFIGLSDVVVHPTTGNIYVADPGQRRVRLINRTTGAVSSLSLPTASTSTASDEYTGVAVDSTGRLLVANGGSNRRILREKTPGSGGTANGFDIILSGTPLTRPRDVVEGSDGALYVTNAGDPTSSSTVDNKIIRITLNGAVGTASVYLGATAGGYVGDGGPITNARIDITPQPIDVKTVGSAVYIRTTVNIVRGPGGELIFTDTNNNAIRRVR